MRHPVKYRGSRRYERFRQRRRYAAVALTTLFRRLFESRSSRPTAEGEEQIAISVVDLDRGAILESCWRS
jgi:hypothetical protein